MNPLNPDPKAGAGAFPPGSEDCGCCDGVERATPQLVHNRGALPAVAYRIGEYGHWHASLTAGLSDSGFQPLTKLLTRDGSDFTLGLFDAFACVADVLTFYQERIANESWLRTATERVSLQEQARLIGYRLRPGVSAETWLAFAVETPPVPPATLKPEPGAFVTGVPAEVKLPAGLRVTSVPGPDEVPQAFETDEALQARWQWNAMPALADQKRAAGFGAREVWLAGTATQLKPGDMLVFVGTEFAADSSSNRWDRRVLTAVEPDTQHQRTRVAWQEPLGSVTPLMQPASPPQVMALRERAAIFGHNAPDWSSMSAEFKRAYLGLDDDDDLSAEQLAQWHNFNIYAPGGEPLVTGSFANAQDVATVLTTSLRAGAQQQARLATIAAAQWLNGGTQMLRQMAQVPVESAAGLMEVMRHVPAVIEEVMAPLQQVAASSGAAVTATTSALSSLQGVVSGLTDAINGSGG